ncbi:MAG: ribbon-helix-helix domain-containing protein [Filifactoraceae bacterium]
MALKSDKTRILVNIPIDLKKDLEEAARQDNRSVSNYILTLLEKHLKDKKS